MYKIKVYKIVNDITDDIYVGSTKNELKKRLFQHKRSRNNSYKDALYKLMLKYDKKSFKIILIQEYEVSNKDEQLKFEQKHIDELKPQLNKKSDFGRICEHNVKKINCDQCKYSILPKCIICDKFFKNHSSYRKHIETITHLRKKNKAYDDEEDLWDIIIHLRKLAEGI